METKFGFTKMSIAEFETYIAALRVARTIIYVQQHHTYSPNYSLFNGNNHFDLQRGMKNHHVNSNGWSDIGQHFSIFPDGTVLTGRSMEMSPACIFGRNQHSICFEHVGNFDTGGDAMTAAQRDAIIRATAAVCKKFSVPVNTDKVIYHHWYRLSDGVRNNGSGGNKSCPGTNFFGGNKVEHCEANFLPLVRAALNPTTVPVSPTPVNVPVLKYVSVTATTLNIRTSPSSSASKATDREAAKYGAVLRIFQEQNSWYKISSSQNHWVFGNYTIEVKRATVNAEALNVRDQPGTHGQKIGSLQKGEEVFIYETKNNWCKIGVEEKWVSQQYLS